MRGLRPTHKGMKGPECRGRQPSPGGLGGVPQILSFFSESERSDDEEEQGETFKAMTHQHAVIASPDCGRGVATSEASVADGLPAKAHRAVAHGGQEVAFAWLAMTALNFLPSFRLHGQESVRLYATPSRKP